MKYFYFGMETMRITQNYNGKYSHYNHSHADNKDFPLDIAGIDNGQSAYFLPVDMKVTAIKGMNSGVTNTIWLVSTEKVITPTFNDYVFLTLTHWNDRSITSKFKVGQIIKANEIIAYEGKDGVNNNHLHLVCGRGFSNNWLKNNKGSWVMKGNSLPPEKVMFLNQKFTKIISSGNLRWIKMPEYEFYPSCDNKYKSIVDALNSINVKSDFKFRKQIALKNKISNYKGSYYQNIKMLNLLKKGILIKP